MGLFKNHKRKQLVVSIQGEDFTLVEPSALALCDYYDMQTTEYAAINDETGDFVKGRAITKVGLKLVSHCLVEHFKDQSTSSIYRMLCEDITDINDANKLISGAEEVAGIMVKSDDEDVTELKLEQTELQDESLVTD